MLLLNLKLRNLIWKLYCAQTRRFQQPRDFADRPTGPRLKPYVFGSRFPLLSLSLLFLVFIGWLIVLIMGRRSSGALSRAFLNLKHKPRKALGTNFGKRSPPNQNGASGRNSSTCRSGCSFAILSQLEQEGKNILAGKMSFFSKLGDLTVMCFVPTALQDF